MVKKAGSDPEQPDKVQLGQLTWSMHDGPVAAWELAKERANFC